MDLILARFREFNPLVVAAAGLIDGINPCAFTTLTLFISYLTLARYPRRETALVGISFILSMFLTYALMGLGAFSLLQNLTVYYRASRILYIAIAALAIALGSIALADYILSRLGRGERDFMLALPDFIRQKIRSMLRQEYHSHVRRGLGLASGAFLLGFFVSLLEGACTGQLYLPTLVFVRQVPELRIKAFSYIILYNLMFILPITAIFLLVLLGVYSERLGLFYRKHLDKVKLALALVFLGLGLYLLINL